ncbi:MAG: S8 family serine peptidase [Acidobacteria bacterium]|nr:S8 family serine peptidase [Acidobacteriota bacterium]
MKTAKFFVYFVLAMFISSQVVSAQKSDKVFADGELLVKYKNGTASAAAFATNDQIGAAVVEEFPELGWQRIKLPAYLSVNQALLLYKSSAEVEQAQPNFYYHLLATPSDPQFGSMYGMQKISAPLAWDLSVGSSSLVVADIDTGLRYTHEDLAANAWRNPGEINGNGIDDDGNGFADDYYGYDFFYNDSDPIDDAGGHGTHTAGTIGAVGNNGLGVVGVNWNVKIMAIKIYSPSGTDTTSTMLINAYNYVRMMKNRGVNIRVTNNSYGGCSEACGYDQATKDAIDALGNAGILNVFAAGNAGKNNETTPFYPASYTSPGILAVASSTSTDTLSGFSNYGAISVDVAAPGSGILSTFNSSNSSYITFSGTSMATPHATGAAALLSSYNPNLSPASLKATLMNTVDPLTQFNGIVKTGGRINVARALQNQTVCTFNPVSTSQSAAAGGGSFSVSVAAPTNCDYSAISDSNWITVTSGNPSSGNGTITFTVSANSGAARSGTIRIGDRTFIVSQSGNQTTQRSAFMDFDGDGRTDYSAIQNVSGAMIWNNYRSSGGYSAVNFGSFADDIPVPNDFDGDGKTDIAVWRNSNGTFYVLQSQNNTFTAVQFGQTGDNPIVSQDFDGDGKSDFAVTRAQNGTLVWYVLGSASGFRGYQFGSDTDKALRGDYDGDGKADLAVYRPTSGSPANTFFIQKSSDNSLIVNAFGTSATDKIVPADYDGDGKTDIAVWRTTNGVWYYLKSSDGNFNTVQFGGISGDLPTPGDYDGDGRTDFAVWRPNTGQNEAGIFYVQGTTAGFSAFGWGNSTMKIPANLLQSQ